MIAATGDLRMRRRTVITLLMTALSLTTSSTAEKPWQALEARVKECPSAVFSPTDAVQIPCDSEMTSSAQAAGVRVLCARALLGFDDDIFKPLGIVVVK